jgi:5-methylcytosine-specific restriction endonuclease McrA
VFVRDGHRCQYCGAQAENIDHVVPRSRGGTHSWDNVVACCRRCNSRKEDRLLDEAGFRLTRPPRAPRSHLWLLAASGEVRDEWAPYVEPVLGHAVGL